MAFTNVPVQIELLPDAEQLDMVRLPREHHREVLVESVIVWLLLASINFGVTQFAPIPDEVYRILRFLPLVVILLGVLITSIVLRRILSKGYALREHDVAYCVGLFWHKTVILPIRRVQHVEVTSGPLQRRFGLASLKFYTAGGASVDLKIEGLLVNDAERLRDAILAQGTRD